MVFRWHYTLAQLFNVHAFMTQALAPAAADPVLQSRLAAALAVFDAPDATPLDALAGLVDVIRPSNAEDHAAVRAAHLQLRILLRQEPRYREALQRGFVALLSHTRHERFFADSGLLPGTGFFSELRRKLVHHLLPEPVDRQQLRDALAMVFHHPDDHVWLAGIPEEDSRDLWQAIGSSPESAARMREALRPDFLRALQTVSHRLAAMGLEPVLRKACPGLDDAESPFVAQSAELHRILAALQPSAYAEPQLPDAGQSRTQADIAHLLVLLDQCADVVRRASASAAMRGTSLELSYLLTRLDEHIVRLESLLDLLAAGLSPQPGDYLLDAWTAFIRRAIRGEARRNSVRLHVRRLTRMLALRVTQNAGRTGEHYITTDRAGYFAMLGSAAAAGAVIAFMALIKIGISGLGLAPLPAAIAYSLNYGLGFVLIHIMGGTIATKQPAMTASAIALSIHESGGRLREVERLATLITDVLRSQFAAIVGNVAVALPLALVIGFAMNALLGQPFPGEAKVAHLLADLDPLGSPMLLHAAIAGCWLFTAGLVSGYVDNAAIYHRIPERFERSTWARRWLGEQRASAVARYLDHHLGSLAGNFLFGFMLGCTGLIGLLLGLNIDIRHIAFSSANLGFIMSAPSAEALSVFVLAFIAVLLVGMVNLAVSFSLALWVAMRSHDVTFRHSGLLFAALWRRIRTQPRMVFWPVQSGTDRRSD